MRNSSEDAALRDLLARVATQAARDAIAQSHASPPPPRRFLNTAEAADYLSVSTQTLEVWRKKRVGPRYTKLQRGVRYDVAELDAFMRGEVEDGQGVRLVETRREG